MIETEHSSPADPFIIQRALEAVQADISNGYQCVPAASLARRHHPQVETALPLILTGLTSLALAPQIKRTLMNAYPAGHPAAWVEYSTTPVAVQHVTLEKLDNADVPIVTACLYVPPLPPAHSFSDLQDVVAHLRSPEGCPWDRAQTLASMRHDLLSECAEVIEAIDAEMDGSNNSDHIAEELGDLIMAAVLMVQIATDEKRFQMADALHSIVTKLIRRHPHVFGDTVVEGVQTVLANWEAIKAQERAASGQTPGHPLDGVPAILPALEKARQLQSKAARAGLLDRADLARADALQATMASPVHSEQSIGELLWRVVALADQFNINAEDALRAYTVHFRTLHSV